MFPASVQKCLHTLSFCKSLPESAPLPMSLLARSSSVGTGLFRLGTLSHSLLYLASSGAFKGVAFFHDFENQDRSSFTAANDVGSFGPIRFTSMTSPASIPLD